MRDARLIQGSLLIPKCCRGKNPGRGFSREHDMCTWNVDIEIADFGAKLYERVKA
jgi:hypothetical protein